MTGRSQRRFKVGDRFKMRHLRLSSLALIAANLIPIFGVFYWGWDVSAILILYWLENLVIGALNVPKIWLAQGERVQKLFLIPFFIFHFGMFCFGHGHALESLFDIDLSPAMLGESTIKWALISMGLSHGFSMMVNFFGRQEYLNRTANKQMNMPYVRIFIMHLVVVLGGMLVKSFGAPIMALAVLVVIKIIIDLVAHRREHREIGRAD